MVLKIVLFAFCVAFAASQCGARTLQAPVKVETSKGIEGSEEFDYDDANAFASAEELWDDFKAKKRPKEHPQKPNRVADVAGGVTGLDRYLRELTQNKGLPAARAFGAPRANFDRNTWNRAGMREIARG